MINLADIATYTVALGIAAAIPGPGITTLVARSVGSGTRAGFALLAGIIMGDLLYLSFAVFGLAITLSNPKTIAFYLALLPLVLDLHTISAGNWAMVLVPATILVLLTVGTVYILGALAVRRILAGANAQRRLHRSAAVAMAGAAGTRILREW